MKRECELDVVIYGATGFPGRLVAEYFLQCYGGNDQVRWAMAGRDLDKLRNVREEIGAPPEIPLIAADSDDASSLRAMAERCRVVLSTVGPYQLYGSALVGSCVDAGCDYVDLCGEPAWMRQMIDEHEDRARDRGARIVFSCGFDSIPFDLGVYFLQMAARKETGAAFSSIKGRVRGMKGGFSGGTIASLSKALSEATEDPFQLTPGFCGPQQPSCADPVFDAELESWAAPFVMAEINTRNVHRTNFLLDHLYGTDFVYGELIQTGPGEKGEAIALKIARRGTVPREGHGPQPGEGPTKEEREAGSFDLLFTGEMEDGSFLRASVKGNEDPGYASTSKMIAESALCLIEDAADLPGGFWTPAAAMGEKLIERLIRNAGLKFALE